MAEGEGWRKETGIGADYSTLPTHMLFKGKRPVAAFWFEADLDEALRLARRAEGMEKALWEATVIVDVLSMPHPLAPAEDERIDTWRQEASNLLPKGPALTEKGD